MGLGFSIATRRIEGSSVIFLFSVIEEVYSLTPIILFVLSDE
jgi:hypothetical protein